MSVTPQLEIVMSSRQKRTQGVLVELGLST